MDTAVMGREDEVREFCDVSPTNKFKVDGVSRGLLLNQCVREP